jgi:hypothetical protein
MKVVAYALWAAHQELNAIRARDGVPYTHEGIKSGVSEEWFSEVVDLVAAAYELVAGEPVKPWPPAWWRRLPQRETGESNGSQD